MKRTSKVQSEHTQSLHYMNIRQFFTCLNCIPPIKFYFATLDSIACYFLVNNLHFITYFTHKGQSADRQHNDNDVFIWSNFTSCHQLILEYLQKNKSFYSNLILMVMRDLNFTDIVCLNLDTA